MSSIHETLCETLEPVVDSMGYEFVGLEYISHEKGTLLRIYIDHPDGINVDACADVSRQVSALLDVEDPISGEYTLEVSSPGLDRPLFTKAHYQKFIGKEIKISLFRALVETNQKRYRGIILNVLQKNNENNQNKFENDQLSNDVAVIIELELSDNTKEREKVLIPLNLIKKANLTVQF